MCLENEYSFSAELQYVSLWVILPDSQRLKAEMSNDDPSCVYVAESGALS